MIRFVDDVLNRVTMYRLMLYYLIFLLAAALVLSFAGVIQYDPFALLFSIGFLLGVSSITNWVFAKTFRVPANAESTFISALILALIITPLQSTHDLWFFAWAGVWAMASKYIVAIDKRHLFNPVAFAVALTYLAINQSASWWVGSGPMLPFVAVGGILVLRKIKRSDLVTSFLFTALATTLVLSWLNGQDVMATLQRTLVYSPLLFFAFVILTEPLTTPPSIGQQIFYGGLVGLLFSPEIHFGGVYTTPEIAILAGNVVSYVMSPKKTLVLRLVRRAHPAPDVYDLTFAPKRRFAFAPGQYMEWTLGHSDPDSRGNRRYFTLASSPTEENIKLGVKSYDKGSTFKQALLSMEQNEEIVATNLAGDFVLPDNPNQKCVFIAGGIGITPFRSMLKYLIDTRQRRPIVVFYANKSPTELVYMDVLNRAQQELGIRTIYTITDTQKVPSWWKGKVGRITPEMIKTEVPDYKDCVFYISGPKGMVDSFKEMLTRLNVDEASIKTDFFSGLA
ncbi:MAG: RnfABCDGE type electron transport complex subunit D [Chloroflexi bacterium]|nr:RnfABCDGE type electron transport complex subunit D [Chloroflexota bacterium]